MSQPTSGLQKNLKPLITKNNVDYSNIRWSLDQEEDLKEIGLILKQVLIQKNIFHGKIY